MTKRLPTHPPGQERGGREHSEPRRKRSYLPQLQNPSWWKTGGWGPGFECAKCCPAHAPDTLNHEQVVATTLQAVWSKGWGSEPHTQGGRTSHSRSRQEYNPTHSPSSSRVHIHSCLPASPRSTPQPGILAASESKSPFLLPLASPQFHILKLGLLGKLSS